MIDKSLILNKIKGHLGLKKDAEFAKYLGIKQNTLSNWHSRNTFDIDLISQKCDFLNYDWLLTGKGEMLKNDTKISEMDNKESKDVDYLKMKLELTEMLLKEKEKLMVVLEEKLKELQSRTNK